MTRLDTPARAVDVSPDGTTLVVGLGMPRPEQPHRHYEAFASLTEAKGSEAPAGGAGGGSGAASAKPAGGARGGKFKKDVSVADAARKEGAWALLDVKDLTIRHETRDSKQWIRCVAYSPDGLTLAVGSTDKDIYLYSTVDLAPRGRCRGHVCGVNRIDFSADSVWLRSSVTAPRRDGAPPRGTGLPWPAGWISAEAVLTRRLLLGEPGPRPDLGGGSGAAALAASGVGRKGGKAGGRSEGGLSIKVGYEALFWDAATAEPAKAGPMMRDVEWASVSVPLAWETGGVWPDPLAGLPPGRGERARARANPISLVRRARG